MAVVVAAGSVAVPAWAGEEPLSVCAPYDNGLHRGHCYRDKHGQIFFLGTLKAYDGKIAYCIDHRYNADWTPAHDTQRLTRLISSKGKRIQPRTVAALSELLSLVPADPADNDTAAAVSLIIREVMSDVRAPNGSPIPKGLKAGQTVKAPKFGARKVAARARRLWKRASANAGPWKLTVSLPAKVVADKKVTATVTAASATGRRERLTASLSYTGFTGPASMKVPGRVTLTAPSEGTARVTVRSGATPSPAVTIIKPRRWAVKRPEKYSQRAAVGTKTAVTAGAIANVKIIPVLPRLTTTTSRQTVKVGTKIFDTVKVTGARPGYTGTAVAVLYGPSGHQAVCAKRPYATVTFPVHGNGTYRTPKVRVGRPGYYSWVETLPAATGQSKVVTKCGQAAETTLAKGAGVPKHPGVPAGGEGRLTGAALFTALFGR